MRRLLALILPLISKRKFAKYVFWGILSGLFSFLFINIITRVIGLLIAGSYTTVSKEYIIIFSCTILFFIWVRRTLALAIIGLSQNLFWTLRKKIITLVLKANFQQLSAKRAKVRAAILSDVYTLMDASLNIIQFFTSAVLAIACLVYLLSISAVLFAITVVTAVIGVTVYHFSANRNAQQFEKGRKLENRFQQQLDAILEGFKEIYMEPKKGSAINDQKIRAIAVDSFENNRKAFTGFLNNQITGQILFYVLISSVLLFFSLKLGVTPADTVSFVFTLLYLLGSIETIMVLLPGIMRSGIAANQLVGLKAELEEARFNNVIPERYISKDEFEQISIRGLQFYYDEEERHGEERPFGIGPVDLDIKKGDTIFIYGANGSGKTTFVNAIIGLCFPSGGEIRLNEELISKDNYSYYKTLFSVVFSNFHLFDELIGIDHVDVEKWNYYIQLFELNGKVELKGSAFTTTDLSAGQRKRLALIAALLENKPVLIMDEWAADQDPYFRKKFYTEIIPLLKQEQITIIAITHDDKYYSCADKLYKMDYGKLIEKRVEKAHVSSDLIW